MNKIYKIGNKEIEFDLPDGDYPKGVKELFFGLTHLLEALSDKEEECNCCGWDDNRYTHEPGCNLREKPKQEECKGDCYFCNPLGWADRNPASTVTTERTEKMRLEHMKNKEPKQSTSLKEEVRKLVKECVYVGELSSEKISDKILSLIQFYLVKEVEQVEPTQYVKRDSELNQTYTQAKLDIIKIINNINI